MIRYRPDLPLRGDQASRFLPWLIVLMVYLAALALAGVVVIEQAVGEWRRELTGSLTIHIAAPADAEDRDHQARLDLALEIVRATPGIARADFLTRAQVMELLAPWLGAALGLEHLPLPTLIDVVRAPGTTLDGDALQTRLAAAMPGAAVDDHGLWLGGLMTLARTGEAIALGIVLLIGLVAVASVVFITRTGLAVHQEVVEVLHLVGARDAYVARQFQLQAFGLSLRGGLIGLALAVATLVAIGQLGRESAELLAPGLALSVGAWLALLAVPLAAAAIAMMTARFTVLRTLAAMP